MKTRVARLASAAALGAALLANGCVDNRASIQIHSVCVPTDDCTFADTCDAQYIGYPSLDLTASTRGTLWLVFQLNNQTTPNGDPELGRGNTNDAHVDETVVEYDGAPLPAVVVGSNFHVPAGGSAVVTAEVIPEAAQASTALAGFAGAEPRELIARVRMRGYYDDGSRFETGVFPVTVRVCSGCFAAADLCAAAAQTCPPNSNGQLPLTCP